MASSKGDEIASKKYFQDNGTLVNKLGITDRNELETIEATIAEDAVKSGLSYKSKELSVDGLKQMHKEMFGDVYTWAGEFRDYTTGRGTPFCRPEYINDELKKNYDMAEAEIKPGMDKDKFVEVSAKFIGELNAVHPFVDGNGRTQRQSLQNLADKAGMSLDLTKLDKNEWYAAAEKSHNEVDYSGFEKIFSKLTTEKSKDKNKDTKGKPQTKRITALRDDDMEQER